MDVILYSTNCPKCQVLEKKLNANDIDYTIINDTDLMIKKGFMSAPMIEVDGDVMDFKSAVEWLKNMQEIDNA